MGKEWKRKCQEAVDILVQDGGDLDVGNRTLIRWVESKHMSKVVSKGQGNL